MASDVRRPRQLLSDGYASDDDRQNSEAGGRFGDLAVRHVAKRSGLPSGELARAYEVRQSSAGATTTRPRFLETMLQHPGKSLAPAQTRGRGLYDRHVRLLQLLRERKIQDQAKFRTDFELLKENHRFVRTEADDDGSWEAELARNYYNRLFREYVLCDLTGYKVGAVGFRWRTKEEVWSGKGQFLCGNKHCTMPDGLRSYEVDFKYVEAGEKKRALVKARLCQDCAYRLHYRRRSRDDCPEKRREVKRSRLAAPHESSAPAAAPEERPRSPTPVKLEEPRSSTDAECMAWSGPDPQMRSRTDEFDDFFNEFLS